MHHRRIFTPNDLTRFAAFALFCGTFAACDCETQTFRAAAMYTPDAVLDFGDVSVTTEVKMDIVVRDVGSAGLKILPPNVSQDPDKWRLVTQDDLLTDGIAPMRTSSISVTYRPCPAAWETKEINGKMVDLLKEGFDYEQCNTDAVDAADLNIVEVDTDKGSHRISLSGRPVQPPNITVYCQNGKPQDCNMPTADVDPCTALTFGAVTAGNPPCDLVVEVRNTWKNGKAVGTLNIEGISINVSNIQDQTVATGAEAGFTVHTVEQADLAPTPGSPFIVPIPNGMQDGRQQFIIKYSGILTGTWDGREQRGMTGVKLYTNDPAHPVVTFAINGTGSSPDIDWQPQGLYYGPVAQGGSKTLTATITNSGDADLRITSIGFANDMTGREFSYTTDRGMSFPIVLTPAQRMRIAVNYHPQDTGNDSDTLIIINNDIKENNRVEIPIRGGAVPILVVLPPDTLSFPRMPPPRRQSVELQNRGSGDLVIQKLEISGEPTSADDFSFADGCPNPCTRQVTLCFFNGPGCGDGWHTFVPINYENNDISNVDYAELHIASTDPSQDDATVVLHAEDDPCLYPTPMITYEPAMPCVGEPVMASAASSVPGGPNGVGGTIVSWDWEWAFANPIPTFNPANSEMTTFTFAAGGTYVLSLKLKNDCGGESPQPANETIVVNDICN